MSNPLTWEDLWGIRNMTEDLERRENLDRQIGFLLLEGQVLVDPRLLNFLDNCSVTQLEEFLSGAPLPVASLFLNRLPVVAARRVLKHFRTTDQPVLAQAYRRPPRIEGPK